MGVKKYFKREFQLQKFKLEHDTASDFYISCWQSNRTVLPLLCVRLFLFLGCLAIVLYTVISTGIFMKLGNFFIYMTNWGLILNTFSSGFALAVSCRSYFKGPIDASFGLPWYVKAFWSLYSTSITSAFFITIFFFSLLTEFAEQNGLDPVENILGHAINSVLMLLLLMTSRLPARWLHFYNPVGFALLYLFFSVIYYVAGGTDPNGNVFIYPALDWSAPGPTMVMVVLSIIGIIVLHLVVVGLTELRDWIARWIRRDSESLSISKDSF